MFQKFYQITVVLLICCFFSTVVIPPEVSAQGINLLNQPIGLTDSFQPAMLSGIKIFPKEPFRFDFILDEGDANLSLRGAKGDAAIHDESMKLIKYFMASLTVPEGDLWVNLSPYEKNRIIPHVLGQTEMGRDLLAQDYILKQLTSSLMHPEGETGQKFWKTIYEKAYEQFGTVDIPVDTFNKVWIVPDKIEVYQNLDVAYVTNARMKVMLEEDYLARENAVIEKTEQDFAEETKLIIREVILPVIEQEVNEGKHFASLRQILNSMILAKWYEQHFKNSVIGQKYVDQNKIDSLQESQSDESIQGIYQQYVDLFKTGVGDVIQEEYDPVRQEVVTKKYFSGGVNAMNIKILDKAMIPVPNGFMTQVQVDMAPLDIEDDQEKVKLSVDIEIPFELPPRSELKKYYDEVFKFNEVPTKVVNLFKDSEYNFSNDDKLVITYIIAKIGFYGGRYFNAWDIFSGETKTTFLKNVIGSFNVLKNLEWDGGAFHTLTSRKCIQDMKKKVKESENRFEVFKKVFGVLLRYQEITADSYFLGYLMQSLKVDELFLNEFYDEFVTFANEIKSILDVDQMIPLDIFSPIAENENQVNRDNWIDFLAMILDVIKNISGNDQKVINAMSVMKIFVTYLKDDPIEFNNFINNFKNLDQDIFKGGGFLEKVLSFVDMDKPLLRSMDIRSYGEGANMSSALAGLMLEMAPEIQSERPVDFPVFLETLKVEGIQKVTLNELKIAAQTKFKLTEKFELEKEMGRSLVFSDSNDNKLVIKIRKKNELKSLLLYEVQVLERMQYEDMKNVGRFPIPIEVNGEKIFKLDLDAQGSDEIKQKLLEGQSRSKLGMGSGFELSPEYTAIAFFVPNDLDYTRYPHADVLETWKDFTTSMLRSVRILGKMAGQKGLLHTELSEMFHNLTQNRRYVMVSALGELSMGRQVAYRKSANYPNIDPYGNIRDTAEVRYIGDIPATNEFFGDDFEIFTGHFLKKKNILYYEFFAEYINTIINLTGRWLSENNWLNISVDDENSLKPLAKFLEQLYVEFIGSFLGKEMNEKELKRMGFDIVDWVRFARQIRFFMSSLHIDFLDPSLGDKRFIPSGVYHPDTEVSIGDYTQGWSSEVGFVGDANEQNVLGVTLSIGAFSGTYSIQEMVTANNILLSAAIVRKAQLQTKKLKSNISGSKTFSILYFLVKIFSTKGGIDLAVLDFFQKEKAQSYGVISFDDPDLDEKFIEMWNNNKNYEEFKGFDNILKLFYQDESWATQQLKADLLNHPHWRPVFLQTLRDVDLLESTIYESKNQNIREKWLSDEVLRPYKAFLFVKETYLDLDKRKKGLNLLDQKLGEYFQLKEKGVEDNELIQQGLKFVVGMNDRVVFDPISNRTVRDSNAMNNTHGRRVFYRINAYKKGFLSSKGSGDFQYKGGRYKNHWKKKNGRVNRLEIPYLEKVYEGQNDINLGSLYLQVYDKLPDGNGGFYSVSEYDRQNNYTTNWGDKEGYFVFSVTTHPDRVSSFEKILLSDQSIKTLLFEMSILYQEEGLIDENTFLSFDELMALAFENIAKQMAIEANHFLHRFTVHLQDVNFEGEFSDHIELYYKLLDNDNDRLKFLGKKIIWFLDGIYSSILARKELPKVLENNKMILKSLVKEKFIKNYFKFLNNENKELLLMYLDSIKDLSQNKFFSMLDPKGPFPFDVDELKILIDNSMLELKNGLSEHFFGEQKLTSHTQKARFKDYDFYLEKILLENRNKNFKNFVDLGFGGDEVKSSPTFFEYYKSLEKFSKGKLISSNYSLTGIEIKKELVEIVRKKINENSYKNIKTIHGGFEKLIQFSDKDKIDFLRMGNVLQHYHYQPKEYFKKIFFNIIKSLNLGGLFLDIKSTNGYGVFYQKSNQDSLSIKSIIIPFKNYFFDEGSDPTTILSGLKLLVEHFDESYIENYSEFKNFVDNLLKVKDFLLIYDLNFNPDDFSFMNPNSLSNMKNWKKSINSISKKPEKTFFLFKSLLETTSPYIKINENKGVFEFVFDDAMLVSQYLSVNVPSFEKLNGSNFFIENSNKKNDLAMLLSIFTLSPGGEEEKLRKIIKKLKENLGQKPEKLDILLRSLPASFRNKLKKYILKNITEIVKFNTNNSKQYASHLTKDVFEQSVLELYFKKINQGLIEEEIYHSFGLDLSKILMKRIRGFSEESNSDLVDLFVNLLRIELEKGKFLTIDNLKKLVKDTYFLLDFTESLLKSKPKSSLDVYKFLSTKVDPLYQIQTYLGEDIGKKYYDLILTKLGYSYLVLLHDIGLVLRLDDFIPFAEQILNKSPEKNIDPWLLREKFSLYLGKRKVYRGLAVDDKQHMSILNEGIFSQAIRKKHKPYLAIQLFKFSLKKLLHAQTSAYHRLNGYNSIMSVTDYKEVGALVSKNYIKRNKNETKSVIYEIEIPVLDLIEYSNLLKNDRLSESKIIVLNGVPVMKSSNSVESFIPHVIPQNRIINHFSNLNIQKPKEFLNYKLSQAKKLKLTDKVKSLSIYIELLSSKNRLVLNHALDGIHDLNPENFNDIYFDFLHKEGVDVISKERAIQILYDRYLLKNDASFLDEVIEISKIIDLEETLLYFLNDGLRKGHINKNFYLKKQITSLLLSVFRKKNSIKDLKNVKLEEYPYLLKILDEKVLKELMPYIFLKVIFGGNLAILYEDFYKFVWSQYHYFDEIILMKMIELMYDKESYYNGLELNNNIFLTGPHLSLIQSLFKRSSSIDREKILWFIKKNFSDKVTKKPSLRTIFNNDFSSNISLNVILIYYFEEYLKDPLSKNMDYSISMLFLKNLTLFNFFDDSFEFKQRFDSASLNTSAGAYEIKLNQEKVDLGGIDLNNFDIQSDGAMIDMQIAPAMMNVQIPTLFPQIISIRQFDDKAELAKFLNIDTDYFPVEPDPDKKREDLYVRDEFLGRKFQNV